MLAGFNIYFFSSIAFGPYLRFIMFLLTFNFSYLTFVLPINFCYFNNKNNLALVSTPRVSQTRENDILVEWKSQGNGRGVFGYRVQYRPDNSPGWVPYG